LIPKGAIIGLILGVVGGGVVGVFFANITNQPPSLVYVNGPSLSIILDKINFRLGEPIHIRIVNSGTVPLTFSDSSYGLQVVGLDGTVIYSPVSAQILSVLHPKQEKDFVWEQTKTDGTKIFEGRYKIVSNTVPSVGNILAKSITINIFK